MTEHDRIEITKNAREGETSLSEKIETEEWRARPYLTLIIENLPSHWMVADLKPFLDGFGNVVKIEIFEDREVGSLYPFLQTISDYRVVKVMAAEK